MIPRSTFPLEFARLLKPGEGKRRQALFLMVSALMVVCISTGTLIALNVFSLKSARAATNSAILTYKGDNYRTGAFSNETALNKSNVNATSFGRHVTYPVDGQVYAEPLFVPNLTIGGSTHNVVFVATEHDGVYAFDADQTAPTQPLWYTSFLKNGATSVPWQDIACTDMQPEIGITGTPVIDSATNTMYVVSYTKENGHHYYRLHALDITTGQDRMAPAQLEGSVPGSGSGNLNGTVSFHSDHERQRSALLMVNGQIYIAFGSFCDNRPYHGWIMAYNTSLQQTAIYNDTANAADGGLWGAGNALSADSSGNIYTISGNGSFDLSYGSNNTVKGSSGGDAFLKLAYNPSGTSVNNRLKVTDFFAPFNQQCLNQADADLGSGGPLQIPGSNEHIGVGKEGRIYVVDNALMGGFTAAPGGLNCNSVGSTTIDKVKQELPPHLIGGEYNTPTYWNNTVYFTGARDNIKAFAFNPSTGKLSSQPTSKTPEQFAFTGGGSITSSNGNDASTAIVWTVDPQYGLRAYDATNLSKELYSNKLDSFAKFSVPSVANGEVFVGTQTSLVIYGLLSGSPTPTPTSTSTSTPTPTPTPNPNSFNNVGISDDTKPSIGNFDGGNKSYSAQQLQQAGMNAGDNVFYNGMVFTWPNAVSGQPDNYLVQGQTVNVTALNNATTLGFLGASALGPTSGTATIHYADGSTKTFTLGFSDWTLGNGKQPVSFGNGIKATLPYRNTPTGAQAEKTYVFYAEVAIDPSKTVKSVTLPSATTGGQLHVFAISTKAGTPPPPPPSNDYNNVGTTDDSNTGPGNFDGTANVNSYSAQALQNAGVTPSSSITAYGTTFVWPNVSSGSANNYIAQGQVLPVTPVSNAGTLAFLGAANNGPSSGQATITYTDNTTQTFTLGFSDWTLNAGAVSPSFSNQVVFTLPYRNTPKGKEIVNTYVFYAEASLDTSKTLLSVTLPSSVHTGRLHVFTISTRTGAPYTATAYTNVGTSIDTNTHAGNFDGGGYSYSSQSLQTAGIKQGSTFTTNGASFIWPAVPAGSANNYIASGQTVLVNGASGSTYLAFLGASSNGPHSGTITITYTDGTTSTTTIGFSDWTLNAGRDKPSFGNATAASMPYRNGVNGKQTVTTYVFYAEVAVTAGKTVASVTLPSPATPGSMHIFAVATH